MLKTRRVTRKELQSTLVFRSGYLRWSSKRVAKQFGVSITIADKAKSYAKSLIKEVGGTY